MHTQYMHHVPRVVMYAITTYTVLHSIELSVSSLLGNEPEEKPASPPLSRLGSGTLASHSATVLDPSDPSYRNYFTKIHAELSPQNSPAVSYKISDEKCIDNEDCK